MRLAASCISPSLEGWATGEQLGDWLHFARGADVADSLRCAGVLLAGLVAEHARADLGAEEDGGQAAAGVGAAADEEEVVEAGEFVLGAEVEHLAQVVGEVEGGAFVDVEALPGVGGVDDFLLDPAAEVDAHLVADLVEGTFAVGRHGLLPVDFAVAVGRGDEQVDAALAFGGEGGVDATGVADVDAGVLADGAVGGDIGEILLVFAADVDGVVREIDIAVNAQVEHGGGAGVFFGVEGLGLILRSCAVADVGGDEIFESPGCVGVDEDVVVLASGPLFAMRTPVAWLSLLKVISATGASVMILTLSSLASLARACMRAWQPPMGCQMPYSYSMNGKMVKRLGQSKGDMPRYLD